MTEKAVAIREPRQYRPAQTKERDWVTPVAVVGGAIALGVGAYFILKRPPGVKPGQDVLAKTSFDYAGPSDTLVVQVSLGHLRMGTSIFDHVEGLTWTKSVSVPQVGQYKVDVLLTMEEAVSPGSYDGEVLVRTPEMGWLEYLSGGKKVTKGAVTILEP